MNRCLAFFFSLLLLTSLSCSASAAGLPAPDPDWTTVFGFDRNINMETIDSFLDRDDVVYRDLRMLFDPADYTLVGGNPDLDFTIEGFRIVPYPYIATLSELPVNGAYVGKSLFTLTWDEYGQVTSATANYEESMMILEELFPQDKAIFLMCGGGGYADMTKSLLTFLGWDPDLLYNVGGCWYYQGEHRVELIQRSSEVSGGKSYCTWRADYALIDFSHLHPV